MGEIDEIITEDGDSYYTKTQRYVKIFFANDIKNKRTVEYIMNTGHKSHETPGHNSAASFTVQQLSLANDVTSFLMIYTTDLQKLTARIYIYIMLGVFLQHLKYHVIQNLRTILKFYFAIALFRYIDTSLLNEKIEDIIETTLNQQAILEPTTFRESHRTTIMACMIGGIRLPENCFARCPASSQMRANYAMLTDVILGLHAASCAIDLLISPRAHEKFCFSISAFFTSLLALLQSLYLREHLEDIRDIVDLWDIVFSEDDQGVLTKSGRFMEIHEPRYKRIYRNSIRMYAFSASVAACFTLHICIENVGSPQRDRILTFNTWFPYDAQESPMYEATILFQMLALLFVGLKQAGFDSVLQALITLQTSQLQLLRETLSRLFILAGKTPAEKLALLARPMELVGQWQDAHPPAIKKSRKNSIRKTAHEQRIEAASDLLRGWIHQHEETLRAGMCLDHIYSPILGVKFAFSILIVSLPTFAFTWSDKVDWEQIGLVMVLMTGNILDTYFLCKSGDDVDRMSESVADLVYESPLFDFGRRIRTSLQFIFQRVESHVHISALGMFPLSLATYARVIEAIASYYVALVELWLIKRRNAVRRSGGDEMVI